ncbi:hypothetical protein [Fusibacter ferrireducens]|uniref:Uncharacterized protein n=1 Tax=Fusibacter ferrireducens TaxID=2785058 RepID=A0ABS0A1A6_9FIRM|nr:hypothetical protein [Fusibacter ferrireducens]MBF4695910.1 hypothetical protein [Fusibacter ferrireducens]
MLIEHQGFVNDYGLFGTKSGLNGLKGVLKQCNYTTIKQWYAYKVVVSDNN